MSQWCLLYVVSILVAMRIVETKQEYIACDYLAIGCSLSIVVQKLLALISIEREFLSVDVKNEVVQIFPDRTHLGKRN